MFESILSLSQSGSFTPASVLVCTAASLILGLAAAFIYMFRSSYTKSFALSLVLLPAMVQIVIMMVNGSLGTGVAVVGAFSLVRFRSFPGTAREIVGIFFAMALGLATGMGYIGFALLFLLLIGGAMLLLELSPFGERAGARKLLRITIPESLDYTGLFDDLFERYTASVQLEQVRTTNMGSLYELSYRITLKKPDEEKAFLDEIRCRNGNLNIICGRVSGGKEEL